MAKRLTVTQRRWLLSAHILFSITWIGLGLSLLLLCIFAASTSQADILQASYILIDDLHRTLYIPLAVITGVTGILLSMLTEWRFLKFNWIIFKEIVILLVIVSGVVIVGSGPLIRGLGTIIQIISTAGLNALNSPIFWTNQYLLIGYFTTQVILLSASVVISVFKPSGGRHPSIGHHRSEPKIITKLEHF